MAERPVFVPTQSGDGLVHQVNVEFKWHPGFSEKQKRKCISSLHESAKLEGLHNVLEISTKSEADLGLRLSAFNLEVIGLSHRMTVESAYQGSKVFEKGGPFKDLYYKSAREAKGDERLRNSGALVGFELMGDTWPLEPKTAFYDWIYVHALSQQGLIVDISSYDGFTDIEFNPKKSVNCQAHAAALAASLYKRGILRGGIPDKKTFIEVVRGISEAPSEMMSDEAVQYDLFNPQN